MYGKDLYLGMRPGNEAGQRARDLYVGMRPGNEAGQRVRDLYLGMRLAREQVWCLIRFMVKTSPWQTFLVPQKSLLEHAAAS